MLIICLASATFLDPNYTLSELYVTGSAGYKMRMLLMQSEIWSDRLTNSNNWLLWPDVAQACFGKLLQLLYLTRGPIIGSFIL